MNSEEYDKLDEGERHLIDWKKGYSGDFFTKLFNAIGSADVINQARLARGFPLEVGAYIKFSTVPDWWQDLCKRVGLEA